MGLQPINQAKDRAVDTCSDKDVAHASPFKRDCVHTCTESPHTGNDARLVSMCLTRAAPLLFKCFKQLKEKIRRISPYWLSLGLRHQINLPLLTELVLFQTKMYDLTVLRAVRGSLIFDTCCASVLAGTAWASLGCTMSCCLPPGHNSLKGEPKPPYFFASPHIRAKQNDSRHNARFQPNNAHQPASSPRT
jgi:hypothetical protein